MPEIIDTRNASAAEWAAFAALGEISEEVWTKIYNANPGILKVELRINDEEVSFTTILNRLQEEAIRWAGEKAREMVYDQSGILAEKLRKLERLSEQIQQDAVRELTKIFPECVTEEDYR